MVGSGRFEELGISNLKNLKNRGHTLKLKKKWSARQARAKFFSNRVVSPWNKLPEEVVMAETTNKFKNGLDLNWATVTLD